MVDAALGAFVLFALLAVAAPFVLYALVRAEGRNRETMTRGDAERVARRDTDSVNRTASDDRDDETANSDGREDRWRRDEDRNGWN